jgi:hypothetical protein
MSIAKEVPMLFELSFSLSPPSCFKNYSWRKVEMTREDPNRHEKFKREDEGG